MAALKLTYVDEIRRTKSDITQITFSILTNVTTRLFPSLRGNKRLVFLWIDDENDSITISTDDELSEALRVMVSENKVTMSFEVKLLETQLTAHDSVHPFVDKTAELAIHHGITCSSCGVEGTENSLLTLLNPTPIGENIPLRNHWNIPIIGIRYRCSIRNLDLCQNCERKEKQPFPLIKIYSPHQACIITAMEGHKYSHSNRQRSSERGSDRGSERGGGGNGCKMRRSLKGPMYRALREYSSVLHNLREYSPVLHNLREYSPVLHNNSHSSPNYISSYTSNHIPNSLNSCISNSNSGNNNNNNNNNIKSSTINKECTNSFLTDTSQTSAFQVPDPISPSSFTWLSNMDLEGLYGCSTSTLQPPSQLSPSQLSSFSTSSKLLFESIGPISISTNFNINADKKVDINIDVNNVNLGINTNRGFANNISTNTVTVTDTDLHKNLESDVIPDNNKNKNKNNNKWAGTGTGAVTYFKQNTEPNTDTNTKTKTDMNAISNTNNYFLNYYNNCDAFCDIKIDNINNNTKNCNKNEGRGSTLCRPNNVHQQQLQQQTASKLNNAISTLIPVLSPALTTALFPVLSLVPFRFPFPCHDVSLSESEHKLLNPHTNSLPKTTSVLKTTPILTPISLPFPTHVTVPILIPAPIPFPTPISLPVSLPIPATILSPNPKVMNTTAYTKTRTSASTQPLSLPPMLPLPVPLPLKSMPTAYSILSAVSTTMNTETETENTKERTAERTAERTSTVNLSDRTAHLSEQSARFVKDVTYPDGTYVHPTTIFTKSWCIRNDGNVRWPEGVVLTSSGGDTVTVKSEREKDHAVPLPLSLPSLHPGEGEFIN